MGSFPGMAEQRVEQVKEQKMMFGSWAGWKLEPTMFCHVCGSLAMGKGINLLLRLSV